MNVRLYYIYNLVENSHNKNIIQKTKPKINQKYLNEIKNYNDRIKSSQISYNEYKEKNENKNKNIKNKNLNQIHNNKNIKNPGIRLYEQNIGHVSKKVQNLKERLEEEKKLEDLKLTFEPKINEYSRKLVGDNYNGLKIENRLINFGKYYDDKKKSKQNISEDNINKENIKTKTRKKNLTPVNNLNFINKPKIKYDMVKTEDNSRKKSKNKIKIKPKKLKRNLTPDKSLYEYLYLESKILKQKRDDAIQKNLDLTCPFKPKLNDSFNKNIKSDNLNVFQRLYNTKTENKKMAKEVKLKRRIKSNIDENTYDHLNLKPFKKYKNKTIYDNINNRTTNDDDNSYINSINQTINNDNIDKSYFNNENKKNYFKKSYITILKAKYIKYVELFNSLDSDKDGIISYKKIKLSNLDSEKLITLSPIFYEIQYKGVEIDFPKFCEKIQNLN